MYTAPCSTTIAGQAFERVLELDPSNADALLGLASIKFNSSNVQQVRGLISLKSLEGSPATFAAGAATVAGGVTTIHK